jgi:hypothetical protein
MRPLVIAVDFDGTLCYPCWPDVGEPIAGAIETMRQWHFDGHRRIVWTCRAGAELEACRCWLDAHRVPYDAINANLPERIAFYRGSDTRKVSADLYVDDRAVGAPTDPVALWRMAREAVTSRCEKPP